MKSRRRCKVVPRDFPRSSGAIMATAAAKKQMVSPADAAEMLSVDRDTVLRWIRAGKLPSVRLSRRIIRIRVSDLDAYIEAHAA